MPTFYCFLRKALEQRYHNLTNLMCRTTEVMSNSVGSGNPEGFEKALEESDRARAEVQGAREALATHRAKHGC